MLLRPHAVSERKMTAKRVCGDSRTGVPADLESRRREVEALLEEIRSRDPTPVEIVQAVETASDGALTPDRVNRITASILSLYVTR